MNLLYKTTADSDSAETFHQKCDKAESSLVLVETDKGKRFGGFTAQNWRGDGEDKMDPNTFLFSLDKMTIYDNIPEEDFELSGGEQKFRVKEIEVYEVIVE